MVSEVASGYAFDGPALELGGLMLDADTVADAQVRIPLAMLNRHGLVAGATGTGKTKTLQLLAEQLSAARRPGVRRRHQGRPVRASRTPGEESPRLTARAASVGQQWTATGVPGRVLRPRRRRAPASRCGRR